QEHGGRNSEVLHKVAAAPAPEGRVAGEALREAVRNKDADAAERMFAGLASGNAEDAFNHLLIMVQDHADVHRVVLPYRAWDLLGIIGKEQAHTLLRQSVRYCLKAETTWRHDEKWNEPREVLTKMFDEYKLAGMTPGTRRAEDAWVDQLSQTIFKG